LIAFFWRWALEGVYAVLSPFVHECLFFQEFFFPFFNKEIRKFLDFFVFLTVNLTNFAKFLGVKFSQNFDIQKWGGN
jgi:hypothetical protein